MSSLFTIYRSSAGSGKTRTLAKEYLKLALRVRSNYFRHILAVTFTNKATQEMKDRILTYLDEFANGKPGDLATELINELKLDAPTFRQYAQEAQAAILHDYSHFSISTIDAFFQKVIRSFTREAGITGDYRLEIDQEAVLQEVIDNLIDELGANKDLTDWVVDFAAENLRNERSWDVRTSLMEFSKEIFREEFKLIEEELTKKTSEKNYFRTLQAKFTQEKNRFLSRLSAPAKAALKIIHAQPWDTNDINYGKQAGLFSFFENMANTRSVKDIKVVSSRIRSFAASPRSWPSKKTPHAALIIEVAGRELNPLLDEIIQTIDHGTTDALTAEVALQNLYVFGLIADISRKLREYKSENNIMLLADAPKFLNGVIQDSDTPFIYEKVGSFYKNYLIDEFQDTSGLQWGNFLPLLLNSLDQGYESLVVGDVKQAIYRWRGGDLNLLQEVVEKNVGRNRVDVKNLNNNFRSSSSIVKFNNEVFKAAAAIVAQDTGESISAVAYHDVEQNAFHDDEGFVEVKFISEDQDEPRWKEKALSLIPSYLERLQAEGVHLKDIAILVRKNEEGQEIISQLISYQNSGNAKPEFKYDVVSGESLRIDTAATVNLLEGAMKYLLNPDDDISRAQLAFEFYRLFEPDRPLTEVFSVTNQSIFESQLPAQFTREKGTLKKLPLFELTETLIEIFKLGTYTGELPYLQAFQNLVLDFYSRERNDLGAFLEWWSVNKRKKSIVVSGDVDAAQIFSIHKSKGLQFRYVIVPFCAWNTDHDSFKAPQLWVRADVSPFAEAGFLPVKYSSTLENTHFAPYYRQEYVKTYLDNLNLLYVALTRAEKGLIILAPDPSNKKLKQTVAQLLHKCLQSQESLRVHFRADTFEFNLGTWGHVASPGDSSQRTDAVSLTNYAVSHWREKLVIRQAAKGYFDTKGLARRQKINYGLHLHSVLSRINNINDISGVIDQLVIEGMITPQEKSELTDQIATLMKSDRIRSWFETDWEVKTEIPVLLPDGSENRIDRLLVKGKKAIVLDFKTGDPVKVDQKQVQEYLDILKKMNFVETEGYLLYLKTNEIISVAPPRARLNKKKDDNQLDLGI